MQQRDIIKEEIEQLGRAIGKLIANFIGLKTIGSISEAIQITNTKLRSDLDLDIARLARLEANELEEYIDSNNLTDIHLDQLASYIFEIGMHEKAVDGNSEKWFEASMRLLEVVGRKSDTITLARIDLIGKIEKELGD
jgi:hypothetical protein